VFKTDGELKQEDGLLGSQPLREAEVGLRKNQPSGFAFGSVNANRRASQCIKRKADEIVSPLAPHQAWTPDNASRSGDRDSWFSRRFSIVVGGR
jgi:hypothetical protein